MFTKITEADLTDKGVTGLPDTPNLSTSDMQAKFDEIGKEVIVPKFNDLIDDLEDIELDKVPHSDDITDFRLDSDGRMQVSTDDGETYSYAGSTGHQIMDGSGTPYPARAKLQFSQNVTITDYESSNKTFLSIAGQKGDKGDAATIHVGTVSSGTTPTITNVGSATDAIFNFTLPKGDSGSSATIAVGTVSKGETASVYNTGTSSNAVFNFVLPKGDKGDTGQGINVMGEYATLSDLQTAHPTGQRGDAYMVGTTNPKNLYIWDIDDAEWADEGTLQGVKGDTGAAGTITVGTVSEGSAVAVENVGTSTNAVFNFTLKKGDKGDTGNAGTISVGTVTSGSSASVTNSGTATAAVFDFVLPKGDTGAQGNPTVINGKQGANVTLYGTDIYTDDDASSTVTGTLEGIAGGDAYSSTTTYAVGDIVIYNNALYKCIATCVGIVPTNTSYWSPISISTINSNLSAIGQSQRTSTLLVSSITTTEANVYSLSLPAGKWLLFSSLRADNSVMRLFFSAFSRGTKLIETGTALNAKDSALGIGCVNLSATTTIYARYFSESSHSNLYGSMGAVRIG